MKEILIALGLLLLALSSIAQKEQFNSPVDIPMILNGNFGELRSNHFHAGIDIKTKGEIGSPIFSIADGCVSRIVVSPVGYGNVLYIDHPNGYTSVYAHLDKFSKSIADWVKAKQYEQKKFDIDIKPEPNLFCIKKGERIATSGNSGSSDGPHLHFEIRKTETEKALNPQHFNFGIKDNTKPVASTLYIYPLSDKSHVENKTNKQKFELVLTDDNYRVKYNKPVIDVFGEIGFGIDAIDYLDGNWSKCGIYQMELWIDDQIIYAFEIDELDFDQNRYLNSHIDYEEFIRNGKRIHKCFIDNGNKLTIYKQAINKGVFNFNDGKKHAVKISLFDINMNAQHIEFDVMATSAAPSSSIAKNIFKYDNDNEFKTDKIELSIPAGNLYTDIDFIYKELTTQGAGYSIIHKVHNPYTPIHKGINIKIKAPELPENLWEKAIIGLVNEKTKKITSLGGQYEKGWVKTESRFFGDMVIVTDTTKPTIRPLSIKDNQLMEPGRLRFKIEDDLSGIASYDGFIDGNWVLFEYDAKNALIVYQFDENISKGKQHIIELLVKDKKSNFTVYEASFYY